MDLRELIDEIEREHCVCGAELDRDKPNTWAYCGIHERLANLHAILLADYGVSTVKGEAH